jgi:hypothetical protein
MGRLSKRVRFLILERDGFRCRYCGRTALTVALHVDHIIPQSGGGTDAPENLVAACIDCNSGKGAIADVHPPDAQRSGDVPGIWDDTDLDDLAFLADPYVASVFGELVA